MHGGQTAADREPVVSAATVAGWVDDLVEVSRDATDAERVDQIASWSGSRPPPRPRRRG
jgi:hypothetical protein